MAFLFKVPLELGPTEHYDVKKKKKNQKGHYNENAAHASTTVYVGNEWRTTPITFGAIEDSTCHHIETTFEWKRLRHAKARFKTLHASYIRHTDTRLGITAEWYSLAWAVEHTEPYSNCRRTSDGQKHTSYLSHSYQDKPT